MKCLSDVSRPLGGARGQFLRFSLRQIYVQTKFYVKPSYLIVSMLRTTISFLS